MLSNSTILTCSKYTVLILLFSILLINCKAQNATHVKEIDTLVNTLPEGNNGIAARHPGDLNITSDQAVIFADDFESYTNSNQVINHWDVLPHPKNINLSTSNDLIYGGKQSLEIVLPQNIKEQSDGINKKISPEQDILFLRYYSKFDAPFDVIGSSHNGSCISAHYFDNGRATPGIPANGTNKFLVNLENWRGDTLTPSPGHLNLYVYHPEQRTEYGDHFFPDGMVLPFSYTPFDFGKDFISHPLIITPLDQWFCYEYMVKANTPGKRDGRIAVWIDGQLVADFQNLRFRDIESLKIDHFGLSFHIKTNPRGPAKKWYDNVVAATSYIGPMVPVK